MPSRTSTKALAQVCCSAASAQVISSADAEALAKCFAALSDPVRLRLLSCVAAADGGEVCACDLVVAVERSQPTVSHHMKILHEAGLVDRDKRGLWVWYRVNQQRLAAVTASLGADR